MSNVLSFRIVSLIPLIFILSAVLPLGNAIICYQCNSEYDPRCGDPFDDFSLGTVNCSHQPRLEHLGQLEPTICRKISQIVYGQTRVVRGCGFITDESSDQQCLRRSGTHDVKAWYCSCTTDLCNAAHKDSLPTTFATLIVTLALTWKIF